MTRPTSREAYEHLVTNKLLVGKQALIIAELATGDATSGETIAAIEARLREAAQAAPNDLGLARQLRSLRNVNAWRARFTELQARGLIVEAGERECAVTGRRALVWHFTGRTKPLKVTRVRRGAKAWRAVTMELWSQLNIYAPEDACRPFADRIRALGGRP